MNPVDERCTEEDWKRRIIDMEGIVSEMIGKNGQQDRRIKSLEGVVNLMNELNGTFQKTIKELGDLFKEALPGEGGLDNASESKEDRKQVSSS